MTSSAMDEWVEDRIPHPSEIEVGTSDGDPTILDMLDGPDGDEELDDAGPTPEDEATAVLAHAATLRVPVYRVRATGEQPFDPASERTDGYEEYMMLAAYTGGDLTHARHRVRLRLDQVLDLWDGMDGWEFYMSGKPRTDKGVELAKTEADPDLAAERRRLRRLEGRLTEEMERMEQEAKFCSRAYTLLSRGT